MRVNIHIPTEVGSIHRQLISHELFDLGNRLRHELRDDILASDVVSKLLVGTDAAVWAIDRVDVDLLEPILGGSILNIRFGFTASCGEAKTKLEYGNQIRGRGLMSVWDDRLSISELVAELVKPPKDPETPDGPTEAEEFGGPYE